MVIKIQCECTGFSRDKPIQAVPGKVDLLIQNLESVLAVASRQNAVYSTEFLMYSIAALAMILTPIPRTRSSISKPELGSGILPVPLPSNQIAGF